MATDMLQYLDPDGLGETVLNIGQIKTSLEGQISNLGESIEEEMQDLPYARPDGLYPDMTVGAVIGADDTAQWATRVTTGSGAATVRSVQGASVVWNQLIESAYPSNTNNGVTFTNNGDGTWTVDGTATANAHSYVHFLTTSIIKLTLGHTYLYKGCPSGGSLTTYYMRDSYNARAADAGNGVIFTYSTGDANFQPNLFVMAGTTVSSIVFIPQLFDLTQMFGSGNEPATVAEFEQMFPAAYYPYSAPTLKPVQIAGIRSTDAQGGELDAIEWPTQTLRAAGSVADMLYSDHVDVNVGVVDLGTLTWGWYEYGSAFVAAVPERLPSTSNTVICAPYGEAIIATNADTIRDAPDKSLVCSSFNVNIFAKDSTYGTDAESFKTAMSGVLLFYTLATPTTTPISPALDMTYKVQQGGSESIIVPAGEVSAAPVITIAEPVNAGDEFARIWAAIQSLIDTRNTAQLSRPVSLTDIDNIDEVQKDTADVVEIDTTKEVTE